MFKTPDIEINKEILTLISSIDERKGYWNCIQKFCDIEKNVSIQDTVKESANAVSKSLKYDEPIDMTGYMMSLNWIFADHSSIDLSEETIDKLYNMIENNPAASPIEKSYSLNSEVAPTENDDDFGSIFGGMSLYEDEAPKPVKNAKPLLSVKDLTDWANKELNSQKLHPILVTSTFVAAFLNLKAYPTANSRLSRILTVLLLLKSGYTYQLFHSLDVVIAKNYNAYEAVYENTLESSKIDYEYWNIEYIKLLEKQADIVSKAMDTIKFDTPINSCNSSEGIELKDEDEDEDEECPLCALADEPVVINKKDALKELPVLQTKIIKMFSKQERITISEVVKTTKANLNTVKKHIAALVEKNLIEKHGKTRGAWYTRV